MRLVTKDEKVDGWDISIAEKAGRGFISEDAALTLPSRRRTININIASS